MSCQTSAAYVKFVGVDPAAASRAACGVIYFNRHTTGELVLLTMYAKSVLVNLTGPQLKEIRRALES